MSQLAGDRGWTTPALYRSLSAAQTQYRQSAASGKLPDLRRELGFELAEQQMDTCVPAADPWLWAPFVLVSNVRQ